MYDGSGWIIQSLLQHQLVISELAPCEGSSYFPLSKSLRNPMKGLINIQKEDNKCSRWCFVKYLNPANKNSAKIRSVDPELAKQLKVQNSCS